jgi:hypothetical protein
VAGVGYATALVLAAAFVWAGAAKLRLGSPSEGPVGPADLVRNGALMVAAAVAATATEPSVPSFGAVVGVGTAVGVTCYTVSRMRRKVG